MTGHDLDLDAIRQRAQYLHATGRGAYYVAEDARDLAAEVESLRAKLAAAEQRLRDQEHALNFEQTCEQCGHSLEIALREAEHREATEQERDALRLIATEAVDAIGSGHSEHWDPTMSYGAGCAACNRERGLRDRLRSSLAAAEQSAPKTMSYYGTGLLARIGKQNNRGRA